MTNHEFSDRGFTPDELSIKDMRQLGLRRFKNDISYMIDEMNSECEASDDAFIIAQLNAEREQTTALARMLAEAVAMNEDIAFDPMVDAYSPLKAISGQQSGNNCKGLLEIAGIVGRASGTENVLNALIPESADNDYFTYSPQSRYDDQPHYTNEADGSKTILVETCFPKVYVILFYPPKASFPDLRIINVDKV